MKALEKRIAALEGKAAVGLLLSVSRWLGNTLTEDEHRLADIEERNYQEPTAEEMASWTQEMRNWMELREPKSKGNHLKPRSRPIYV